MLLAPTTTITEGRTMIVECDQDVFLAIRDAVEVAFEDPPADYPRRPQADALWAFFVKGENQP